MNISKSIVIIWVIIHFNLAFALEQQQSTNSSQTSADETIDIIDPPNTAALNIMISSLSSLKELRKQNMASAENVEQLINIKLLPNIALEIATELALKKHWNQLNAEQKSIFQAYIKQSLIRDYAGVLGTYEELDKINIMVNPEVKRKDNKAIVKLSISLNQETPAFDVTLKLIRFNRWQIYDVVFSGVSIIKNYAAQFNSHIKRKGIDSLVEKTRKKIK